MEPSLSFATQAVHAGERGPKPDFTPVTTPIYQSASFVYDTLETMDAIFGGERPGYVYTRYGNPTVAALERAVATLEGGDTAVAYASGMAAIHATLLALDVVSGGAVVAAQDLYGATSTLLTTIFARQGVHVRLVDMTDLDQVERTVQELRPTVVMAEMISNPLLKVIDLEQVATIAHAHGAIMVVDSTFTSPYLLQPLRYGADLVIHSATKFLGGHGDVTGGIVVAPMAYRAKLELVGRLVGGILSPHEAYLTLRGIKTLPLRLRQQCHNAMAIARWLAEHPRIGRVHYPGLEQHPGHGIAKRLLRDGCFGSVLSFELVDGDQARVFTFLNNLRLGLLATTLGDIYTELLYPTMSSHRMLSPEQRAALGISDALIRLSAGIEEGHDLIADLEQALHNVS
ncbi:MAG TPA: aminotransferase class I/II-fold pyridoxal phosphate-dependent enzyme [Alphaproteobacteria bacterium]|nr:aminotransferase class I/II-fold pyridoxal phosphate-dependent enzyme [Alphaproteobacteria bacterium]